MIKTLKKWFGAKPAPVPVVTPAAVPVCPEPQEKSPVWCRETKAFVKAPAEGGQVPAEPVGS